MTRGVVNVAKNKAKQFLVGYDEDFSQVLYAYKEDDPHNSIDLHGTFDIMDLEDKKIKKIEIINNTFVFTVEN